MSERFEQLAVRRRELLARCSWQREQFGRAAGEIQGQLDRVDRAIHVVRGIVSHPAVIAGAIATVFLLGPRRLLHWATRSALFYNAARRFGRLASLRKL